MSIDNIVFINNLPSLDLHGFTKDFAIIAINEFIKDNIDGFIIKSCFYDGYIIENNALYLNDPANWTVGYSGKCFDFEVDF